MTNIVRFQAREESNFEKNLNDFIRFGSELRLLNDDYAYESHYWKHIGNFTQFGVSSKKRERDDLLLSPLIDFGKAYVTYLHKSVSATNVNFYALRAIDAACRELHNEINITLLTRREFDLADHKAEDALSEGAAYQAGRGLGLLLQFLIEHKMIKPFTWKTKNKKPREKGTSEKDELQRQKKMPDERAIMAIARVSSMKDEDLIPRDIFTTSIMTMLMSVPARASEVFYLRHDCLHTETISKEKALGLGMTPGDISRIEEFNKAQNEFIEDDSIQVLGVRWFSGKGYGHENKWLPSVMYELVCKAIERLRRQSEGARRFAKLLEDSRDFPRHSLCPKVAEDTLLTKEQAAMALGLDVRGLKPGTERRNNINSFLRQRDVPRKDHAVTLEKLNKLVRSRLPKEFPYIAFRNGGDKVKLKWSEALFAGFTNMLDKKKSTIFTELTIPTINTLNEDLAPTKKKNRLNGAELTGTQSLFQRWDYGNLSMTSHQFRHLLDTLAAVNGMDEDLRAKWAQRSDPKHNRYYDHTPAGEYSADYLEDKERENALVNSSSNYLIEVQIANPTTIQELNTKAALTAHTTEFGICRHSYLSEPCHMYRDCINCDELVCIKGDDGKCERIRSKMERERKLLKKDTLAIKNNVPGAERWLERRKKTIERGEQLLKLMDDPSIEDGSIIKLESGQSKGLLEQALEKNGKKILPPITNFKRLNRQSQKEQLPSNSSDSEDMSYLFDELNEVKRGGKDG